jgi:predicted transcriptional regulator
VATTLKLEISSALLLRILNTNTIDIIQMAKNSNSDSHEIRFSVIKIK